MWMYVLITEVVSVAGPSIDIKGSPLCTWQSLWFTSALDLTCVRTTGGPGFCPRVPPGAYRGSPVAAGLCAGGCAFRTVWWSRGCVCVFLPPWTCGMRAAWSAHNAASVRSGLQMRTSSFWKVWSEMRLFCLDELWINSWFVLSYYIIWASSCDLGGEGRDLTRLYARLSASGHCMELQ